MPPTKNLSESTVGQTLPDNHKNATNVLLSSLAEIEVLISPLTAAPNSLSETLTKLDNEKRCQLELLLAYALNTLAFINLKSNGIPSNSHPVMSELKRIQAYTEKLRHATYGNKPSMSVDKDAAERFIKGALASNAMPDSTAPSIAKGEGKHSKFDEQGKEIENDDDQKKNVIQGSNVKTTDSSSSSSTAGTTATTTSSSSSTRKRMDPFQGYGENKKKRN